MELFLDIWNRSVVFHYLYVGKFIEVRADVEQDTIYCSRKCQALDEDHGQK